MKIQSLLLIFFCAFFLSFSHVNKGKNAVTKVYHYKSNVVLNNFDGTQSTVYIKGNSATLFNTDGTQATINFYGNMSNLIASDGSVSTATHTRMSSNVMNADGTRMMVNHMQVSSSCTTENGKHSIEHTFGTVCEKSFKRYIDVLIHRNWQVRSNLTDAIAELNVEDK